jgi:hypothetical protein
MDGNNKCLDPFYIHHRTKPPKQKHLLWILNKLAEHLPYSIFSAFIGLLFITTITLFNKVHHLTYIFHLFHPTHLLLSATATTAMFWRFSFTSYRTLFSVLYAIVVGFTGSVAICGLSDIVLPYLFGLLYTKKMVWHFCLSEHPLIILPFVSIGIILGFWSGQILRYSTFLSHSAHVLISTMASVLYLMTFGLTDWMKDIGIVFLITIISVIFTCCMSDIIYPLIFVKPCKSNTTR